MENFKTPAMLLNNKTLSFIFIPTFSFEESFVCLHCCFTFQVNSFGHGGWSVHLTTLFHGQA